MAYFFRQIDRSQSSAKSNGQDAIFNLDKFHTIYRKNNEIIALGDNNPVVIAVCKTSAGAEYVLDCIQGQIEISVKQLNIREREL